MKRRYIFVLSAIIALLGFKGYAQETVTGTVKIDGEFYTFVAQNPDDTRDEAFAFSYATYATEVQGFEANPEVTYVLKGQNPSDTFFVYINGVLVPNEAGEDETGYVANVKFAQGDFVEIYQNSPYVATVTINGSFYTFVAQNPDNTRDEAFDFTYDTYNDEALEFVFSPGVTYTLKGQNETNTFAVFVNGVALTNELSEEQTGYEANVKFQAGDKVEIYQDNPYVAKGVAYGQLYTFVAQNPNNTRDEAINLTSGTYDGDSFGVFFSPAVAYTLKGYNESNTIYVYINGVQVKNEAGEGETGFIATNVKFQSGDLVEIYQETPFVGTVTVNGQLYTFVAQNPDNTRDEAFAFTNATYDNQTEDFYFSPSVTYTLKGQNKLNTFVVKVNGEELANEAEEGETGYVANVQFHKGDVVEIEGANPNSAIVRIDGSFYTFVAQNPDNTRDEAFAFTQNTYDNEECGFAFDPEVTYTLKGQNPNDTFFVYINGVLVPNEAGEGETGYVANVKFNVDDVVEIYEATPYVATVTIDGQFYTFAAQAGDDNRDEAFVFINNTFDNETQEFYFSPGATYTLKGQNLNNTFYVYVNGVELPNEAGEGETGYVANVQFHKGDVVEICENNPFCGTVLINGQFYTFVAQNPDNTRDEAFAFTQNTYDNETRDFTYTPGVTYTLKGYNEANTFYVYVNGVELPNEAGEGETGYVAYVDFNKGDVVEIYDSYPYSGVVKVTGQFYTFTAQAGDDNRDEAFAITNGEYDNEEVVLTFTPGVTYTLKGQNESNSIYVYINGVELKNEAGEGETGYVANVEFQAGDVVEIYENTPYVATVTIDGQFYTFVAQNADNTRDEAFAFTFDTYNNATSQFNFNPGVTYTLKGQNETNTFYVYVNNVLVENELGEDQTGYEAAVKFNIGDVVEIYAANPYVGTLTVNGQFYTFVAQAGDDNRDEAFAITNGEYDNETIDFSFTPGAVYTLKGQNESNTFCVLVDGVELANEAGEGESGYVATVEFNAGTVVELYETSPYIATVNVNGQFYTFVAQNEDNTRDEAFVITNGEYVEETSEFTFNPAVTYTLKGQNEANSFYVYVNGIELKNQAGEGETGYVANVKFNIGDVVDIYEVTPYVGTVTINGQFYTFVAQGGDDNRNEPFDFTNDTYDNETRDFTFSPSMTYELKGQNEANTFYVYINGVEVPNQYGEGEQGFYANVKFNAGDKVEIFEATPYVASVTIDGQFYTFVAQNEDNTRDEAFDFTNAVYDNETYDFTFNPGVTYALKGQNEANVFYVYVNGELIPNEYGEGEQGFYANVKFNIGDVVEIYEATPYVATYYVEGQFYTFVAQNADNTRDEAFVIGTGNYDGEVEEFTFNPGVTYTLKAQNESNSYYVYINGVQVANEAEEGMNMFLANVKFNAGDLVEIYENTPFVASVTINGQFYTFVAQNPDNTRDEAFDFTNAVYDNETREFTFNPAVEYVIKGQNEANKFYVTINGVEIANEVEAPATGFEATVTFKIGDIVEIYNENPTTGINEIMNGIMQNGKIYNLQGIEMKNEGLAPGIYIQNGQKFILR